MIALSKVRSGRRLRVCILNIGENRSTRCVLRQAPLRSNLFISGEENLQISIWHDKGTDIAALHNHA